MYTPNNVLVFIAAYAGAISGMAVAEKILVKNNPTDYDAISKVAGAFAQSFDTEWGLRATTRLDVSIIEEECEGTWEGRYPNTFNPSTVTPSTYTKQCKALIALVTSSEAYFAGQGIVPPSPGGDTSVMTYTVFVAKNGNDSGADGSVDQPFLTVQAAMDYAWSTYVQPLGPQPSPPFTRPCVYVNAGTYDDGDLVLPPDICVQGEGYNHSRIEGNWSIDDRWSNYTPPSLPSPPSVLAPNDCRSTWLNVGLFGDIDIDFGPVFSNEGKLYAQGVRFGGNVTLTEKLINPVSNSVICHGCEFTGDLTLNGIPIILEGCITFGGTMTLNQQSGTGVDNIFESCGGSFGNIVINSGGEFDPPYTCKFNHSAQADATLTLNGAYMAIKADDSSLPLQSNIILSGGGKLSEITRLNQPNFSGITAIRPAAPYKGEQWFDTTLGLPIWWNGVAWITASGTVV